MGQELVHALEFPQFFPHLLLHGRCSISDSVRQTDADGRGRPSRDGKADDEASERAELKRPKEAAAAPALHTGCPACQGVKLVEAPTPL